MPKVRRSSSLSRDRSRAFPYPCMSEDAEPYKLNSPLESTENAKEWEDARCPICMEHPHNAVLIKCSSHEKGCRPYMCNTSYRHSNCLDQFCKSSVSESTTMMLQELPLTHTARNGSREEALPGQNSPCGNQLQLHPACPLCRGEVYGYIVVKAARHFMNCKVRTCSSETCDFSGTYSELRKHARLEHPYVRPSEVDPNRHRDWMRLERQRDLQDVLSMVHVGSGDEFVSDLSTDSGWMTSLLSAMLRTFELILFSPSLGSSSDMEHTHGRRSGRTTRIQQDIDTIHANRRDDSVLDSTSRHGTLLYRRSTNNNAETSHTPRWSHNSSSRETGDASRRSNNSLEEATRPPRGVSSFYEEGTNRALRRGNNTQLETTFVHIWENNSLPEESNFFHRRRNSSVLEEGNHVHRHRNSSVPEEGNHVHRQGSNSVSEESRWGNNSRHGPRWSNTFGAIPKLEFVMFKKENGICQDNSKESMQEKEKGNKKKPLHVMSMIKLPRSRAGSLTSENCSDQFLETG